MIKNRTLLIIIMALTLLNILIASMMIVNYLFSRNEISDSLEYKLGIKSSLSEKDFIENIINKYLEQRNMIDNLEVEVAEKDLMIRRLIIKHNITSNIDISPFQRIEKEHLHIYNDRVVIYVNNAFAAEFTPSTSMHPFIYKGALALEINPDSPDKLEIGDIIGYESRNYNTSIIHRIINISEDENGWYAITKGDNNQVPDPEKVRFDDITGVLIGLIY